MTYVYVLLEACINFDVLLSVSNDFKNPFTNKRSISLSYSRIQTRDFRRAQTYIAFEFECSDFGHYTSTMNLECHHRQKW